MQGYERLIDNSDVISFDLFDTLFIRDCYLPTDLFEIVSGKEFKEERINAERQTRELYNNKEEIEFKNIYSNLNYSVMPELNAEYDFIHLNQEVFEILKYAKKQNKIIIITSDMYLDSAFISKILKEKFNILEYFDNIFMSSEQNVTKHTGNIWNIIKAIFPNKTILHIDDRQDLCNKANEYEIETILIPQNRQRNIKIIDDIVKPYIYDNRPDESITAALIVNNKNEDFWYNIGFNYCGITCLKIIEDILKLQREKQFEKILFLSRDGYLPCTIYEEFFAENNIDYEYFHISRHLQNMLSINENTKYEDFEYQQMINYYASVNIDNLNQLASFIGLRIDVNSGYYDKLLKTKLNVGYNNKEYEKHLISLKEFMRDNFYEIKDIYLKNKNEYEKYIEKFKNSSYCVFDLGWYGSSYYILREILDIKVAYYFGCYTDDDNIKRLYKTDKEKGDPWNQIAVDVLENIFTADHNSWNFVNKEDNWMNYDDEKEFHDRYKKIESGTIDFCRKFLQYKDKYKIEISQELIQRIWQRLFNEPTEDEVKMLGSVKQYNGLVYRYPAKPSSLAYYNNNIAEEELKQATWKKGYLKLIGKDGIELTDSFIKYAKIFDNNFNQFIGKKIICIGAGALAKYLLNNSRLKELNVIAFIDSYAKGELESKPIYSPDELNTANNYELDAVFNCINNQEYAFIYTMLNPWNIAANIEKCGIKPIVLF